MPLTGHAMSNMPFASDAKIKIDNSHILQAKQASKSNSDWMFGGDGAYAPNPSSAVDMKLRLHEIVNVSDIGLVPHPARALLDSGILLPARLIGDANSCIANLPASSAERCQVQVSIGRQYCDAF